MLKNAETRPIQKTVVLKKSNIVFLNFYYYELGQLTSFSRKNDMLEFTHEFYNQ
jgi:hypothetical protein